ncbi:hypothetical protein OE88DRAFT_1735504 [Heliocybe sulcata]|uniref:rRNA-processing protein EFG1 n=1 Tax=Heliocybe sulcata TaxID=5364 RepID=A0A5C3N0Q4_9AGAM|nr:hypothetical protein OE88DRAFT_1735504 [Heliocybe sulcata]
MGPSRTRDAESSAGGSSSRSKPKRAGPGPKSRRPKSNHNDTEPNGMPGVQKLKSQLRQTRRLLAKDNLAADVRVATERRLKSLEADLEAAERTRKERALAVRYHKIKFFERQKVVRRISQTQKKLSGKDLSSKSRCALESALLDLRVDLNYILHYPKLQKYISLFPPEVRHGEAPPPELEQEKAKTDARRAELRVLIRKQMEDGLLSREPELEKDFGSRHKNRSDHDRSNRVDGHGHASSGKKGQSARDVAPKAKNVLEDDFFGGEDSGEEDEDESMEGLESSNEDSEMDADPE